MRRTLIVVFVLWVAACSGDGSRGGVGVSGSVAHGAGGADDAAISSGRDAVIELGSGDVVLTAGLVRFDGCGALLDHLHSESLARIGPWGFDDDGWSIPEMAMEDAEPAAEAAAEAAVAEADAAAGSAEAAAPVEGVDFSGTNVQEAGVDEADIVKTDGRRIFTVSSGRLVVVDAADRSIVGSTVVAAGWDRELFIDGDSLLLITRSISDAGDGAETVLQSFDVSGGVPEVMWTVNLQGEYVSARSVDGTVRVILRYDPPDDLLVVPYHESAEDVAEASNRAAILDSTLDDWLPQYAFGSADTSTGAPLVGCDDVHAPSVFSGFGVTTVISVPVGGDFDPSSSTAVLAPGDTVYASTGSLYVATTRWVDSDEFGDNADWDEDGWRRAWQERHTSIHRFDIAGAQAVYESSGVVLGVIHNQFSLSEHNGYLRIVTTVEDPWGEETESWVRVLSTDGDVLVEVGSVGDIGRGEDVHSVRFVGDIGYVVTFRQIDPFYAIDLSDPNEPEILGELKIPGFSSYLHPIGDTLVLGVGSDADEVGRVTGAKVSLFDVSDLTEPREVAAWTAPDGWNDVGWDHRAFLWWAPEELAVIPVTVWNEWSGAVVLRVTDGAITEVGRVDHETEGAEIGRTDCRRLTAADVPPAGHGSSIEYDILDDSNALLACELGEAGMTGFECAYRDSSLTGQARDLDMLRGNEWISRCWPGYQSDAIVRSIVIGNELWTLSFRDQFDIFAPARLHAHDLRTLNRVAALELAPDPEQAHDVVDDHGDRIAEATPAELGEAAAGVLESPGDVDVFVFAAAAGETYQIDVALGTLSDSTVTLYDTDGYQLAYNDDHSGTLASRLNWETAVSGPLYVGVAGYNTATSTGTYTLTIALVSVDSVSDRSLVRREGVADDHADSREQATPVAVGEAAAGELQHATDLDYFAFEAELRQLYQIDVTLGTLSDSTVTLYGADGYELAYNDDHGDTLASRLHWQAAVAGPHYIGVAGYRTATGTYTLTITHS